jgi:GTP cyclohydrolase I
MSILTEKELFEILGDNHQMTTADTPLRGDAFLKSDAEKMATIEHHFHIIMQ